MRMGVIGNYPTIFLECIPDCLVNDVFRRHFLLPLSWIPSIYLIGDSASQS